MKKCIPLHKPYINKKEEQAVLKAIRSGQLAGDGLFGKKLQKFLENYLHVQCALPTPSCTAALELALMTLNIQRDDEVILPSYTFVSTATAVCRQNARPVFVDINKKTYNIDPIKIRQAITKRTKTIIVVHYAGQACDMDEILAIAKKYRLKIIEDAAHALGAEYKGKKLGTIGDVGCFSFHQTKNIVCGEGGAFVTNNNEIAQKARVMREKGTNRTAFLLGTVDKYTWVDQGSNFLLAEPLAAIATEQLKKIDVIIAKRTAIAKHYNEVLQPFKNKIILPYIMPEAKTNWHIFPIRVKNEQQRAHVIRYMKNQGVETPFHFLPLHSSPMGKKIQRGKNLLPITDDVASTLIRLPLYPQLTKKEIHFILASLAEALKH